MHKPRIMLGAKGATAPTFILCCLAVLGGMSDAWADTYQVGPSRTYTQLDEVADMLEPGDVVELDGDNTYDGGVRFEAAGTLSDKITIRGIRVNGKRPVITGGNNAIEAAGNHYVFEGLDITNGESRCFFHHANDVTIRDSVIHDCPKQGLLGADEDSGSLLLEYSEVYHCGGGTYDHQIYMATDGSVYPDAVFRMQFNYVHDANGGNNVKSRAGRNEIYYNWIEGAMYHELELIGSDGGDESIREDSDVVGNVLIKRNDSSFVTRFGGDGTGETLGRYRFVNNTVVVQPDGPAVFRLFDGIESLEAHNNVFAVNGSGAVTIVREVEASWVGGDTTITGTNNWIQNGAEDIPDGFSGSLMGNAPGFEDLDGDDLRPATDVMLIDAGNDSPSVPGGFPTFPNPLPLPLYLPPQGGVLEVGTAEGRNNVDAIDIGAFELGGGGPPPPGMGDAGPGGPGGPDGGPPGGGGGDGGDGDDGDGDSSGNDDSLDGGCGCRASSRSAADTLALLAAYALIALVGLRRRRRGQKAV